MKYEMKTKVLEEGCIEQTLLENHEKQLARWVCNTKEEGIRNALIELGWTPPQNYEFSKSTQEQTMNRKHMSINEFRENGYLQELNRQFLHPLGLALEVYYDEGGNCSLSGIWDLRDDPEGICYNLENSNHERIKKFEDNKKFILNEFNKRKNERVSLFNSIIEPIPNTNK